MQDVCMKLTWLQYIMQLRQKSVMLGRFRYTSYTKYVYA